MNRDKILEIAAGTEGVQGGPWKLDKFACYIWAPSEKGGDFPLMDEPGEHGRVAELRGWGYYTGNGHGALGLHPDEAKNRQRLTGEHVARLDPATVKKLCRLALIGIEAEREPSRATDTAGEDDGVETHGLDTQSQVFFYEQDFYVLSNFSAFNLRHEEGGLFATSEHAYHWCKFYETGNGRDDWRDVRDAIGVASSAHEAFKIAERHKHLRRADWDAIKVDVMRDILRAKADQHEYVRRKLLATGDRELVENSWRDDFWGWGPNRDGKNMLGKLWMEVRAELRSAP